MRKCMDSDNLHKRLNKVIGQIKAIDRMIDEDVPCEDVLIQINAVRGAMQRVGKIIFEGHLHHCLRESIEHGDVDRTIEEFEKAVEHFSRMK